MNHGHQFDAALSAERKAEQERKQKEHEARKKLEAAAPDLLAACEYYRNECSGAEPSISIFERMLDRAILKAKP